MSGKKEKVIIKKYANRRLYNTQTSIYITLEDLYGMIKRGEEIEVHDAKTNEDITRSVLTQIIFEQENKGFNILPVEFLLDIIRFYDDGLQSVLPHYLNATMQSFTRNQEKMRKFTQGELPEMGINMFEEMTKRNMALFEQTIRMFSPFNPLHVDDEDDKKNK